ncbi:unnamed protein product [Scytosiphon promiscuus]
MASPLSKKDWENQETALVFLPPPTIVPRELSLSAEIARTEGLPLDKLPPQATRCSPREKPTLTPPALPLGNIFRPLGIISSSIISSEPIKKQRVRPTQCIRCARSALHSVFCLLAVGLAILIVYWSLFPMCTACDGGAVASSGSADLGARAFSTLRINQLQVLGTHNSYHRRTNIPALRSAWPCHYSSITAQLDAGVRHLELDIHFDWKTGRWFVYHISVVDPLSSCHCLLSCLHEIRVWSDLNPSHHIIFMDIELKLTGDFLRICGHHTPGQDRAAFLSLQDSVLEAFLPERILTPRDVRGDYDTLFEAVRAGGSCVGGMCGSDVSSGVGTAGAAPGVAGGWPLVDETRGMVLFVMDYQTVNLRCRAGIREALPFDDTVFFERVPHDEVETNPPYAAFSQLPQTYKSWEQMTRTWVRKGLIVRQIPGTGSWVVPTVDEGMLNMSSDGNKTYLADTPAQLLVADDVTRGVERGVCRSRCSPLVPEEECILEGFC